MWPNRCLFLQLGKGQLLQTALSWSGGGRLPALSRPIGGNGVDVGEGVVLGDVRSGAGKQNIRLL